MKKRPRGVGLILPGDTNVENTGLSPSYSVSVPSPART